MEPLRMLSGLAALLCACGAPESRTWVADRAAHEVVALDDELCVSTRLALHSPRLVVADAGGLWVAAGRLPAARAPGKLLRLEPDSGTRRETDFGALLALCAGPDGAALVLEQVGARETLLWSVAPDLRRTLLGAFPAARVLAARAGAILLGCEHGELVLLDESGAVVACGTWPARPLALAPGPRLGEWWALGGGAEAVLGLLGRDLAPRWSVHTGLTTPSLAPVPGEERVWVAAEESVRRYGAGGVLELALELAGGPWRAALATDGRATFLGVGAVLELDSWRSGARVGRTQGGFDALSALAVR